MNTVADNIARRTRPAAVEPARVLHAARWLSCASVITAAALSLTTLTGCAAGNGKAKQSSAAAARHRATLAGQDEEFGKTLVISNNPVRDTIAYEQAEERLSEADWKQLEKLGPRPIWEQLAAKKKRNPPKHKQHARRASIIEEAPAARGPAAEPSAAPAQVPGQPPAQPVAQPLALGPAAPAPAPSTQPATQPSTQPVVATVLPAAPAAVPARLMPLPPEDELPVEIVELPDGKLRMIWRLRSYGGTSVDYAKNGGTTRRDLKVTPSDLTPLVTVVQQYLGVGGLVVPLPKENTLVIMCPRETRASVLNLLNTLDVPPRQVQITAKIFEVSRDFDFQQGTEIVLKHLAADNAQNLTSTFSAKRFLDSVGGQPTQGSVLRLMQAFSDAGISVDMSFQLLAEAGMINVVSSPRMTVAVGQTGYMLAGQELPIQSANITNNVLTVSTSYKPVGVQLYVTPQAVGDNRVKLHTISIVSAVSGFSPLPTMDGGTGMKGAVNPIIDSREAETAVTVEDGSTLVISGLRMVRMTTRENKIPGLGDLPVLGWMFKNHRTQQQQTDLYFFLTPTLL